MRRILIDRHPSELLPQCRSPCIKAVRHFFDQTAAQAESTPHNCIAEVLWLLGIQLFRVPVGSEPPAWAVQPRGIEAITSFGRITPACGLKSTAMLIYPVDLPISPWLTSSRNGWMLPEIPQTLDRLRYLPGVFRREPILRVPKIG